jgi:hypothetical protein
VNARSPIRAADVSLSLPQLLAQGFRPYQRYRVTLEDAAGMVEPLRQLFFP